MSLKLGLRNKIRRSRAGGFTGLLDQSFASGATAAYSLRKLKSSATKAVRVREDSGNTETDIGFSGGTLDETALSNHCGSANGFVSRWYDQSGNGNDASNSTASQQPQMVNSGSVIKENNRPTIKFDNSNDFLDNSTFTLSQPNTSIVVGQTNNPSVSFEPFIDGTSTGRQIVEIRRGDFALFASSHSRGNPANSNQNLMFGIFDDLGNDNSQLYINGGSNQIGGDTNNNDLQGVRIGANQILNNYLDGSVQEIILYSSDKSSNRNNIETNINGHYSIF